MLYMYIYLYEGLNHYFFNTFIFYFLGTYVYL